MAAEKCDIRTCPQCHKGKERLVLVVDKLIMKRSDYERILAHAQGGLPNEMCGLLAGTVDPATETALATGTVEHVYLLTNLDASNEHFTMDPKEQLAAVKDARAHGWDLLGNWHSHPETPARPSVEDKRLAYDPTTCYLILSLEDAEHPALNAYHIGRDGFAPRVLLKVED